MITTIPMRFSRTSGGCRTSQNAWPCVQIRCGLGYDEAGSTVAGQPCSGIGFYGRTRKNYFDSIGWSMHQVEAPAITLKS